MGFRILLIISLIGLSAERKWRHSATVQCIDTAGPTTRNSIGIWKPFVLLRLTIKLRLGIASQFSPVLNMICDSGSQLYQPVTAHRKQRPLLKRLRPCKNFYEAVRCRRRTLRNSHAYFMRLHTGWIISAINCAGEKFNRIFVKNVDRNIAKFILV